MPFVLAMTGDVVCAAWTKRQPRLLANDFDVDTYYLCMSISVDFHP